MRDIQLLNSVPSWAQWLAQDERGAWYVYRLKPVPDPDAKPGDGCWQWRHNSFRKMFEFPDHNPNWRKTLMFLGTANEQK